jgi:hypothetical protein
MYVCNLSFYLFSEGSKRGLHNIDDGIYFRSKPGFFFHDSRGVEAGSVTELSNIQRFVHERSLAATDLRDQLHAIWYLCVVSDMPIRFSDTFFRMCLPLDDCRELFESERDIFRLLKGMGKWQMRSSTEALIDKA